MDKIKSIDGLEIMDVTTMEIKHVNSEAIIQSLKRANKFKGVH